MLRDRGEQGRHRRRRSVEPVLRRRDPRRPHPHDRPGERSRASIIRSMATRGATGGMARAALDAVDILDVAGYRHDHHRDRRRRPGRGRDRARPRDTTVVVSAPGLGDEIQAIKAGMLEIADIHVVSQVRPRRRQPHADRPEADADARRTDAGRRPTWQTPVIGVSALDGRGPRRTGRRDRRGIGSYRIDSEARPTAPAPHRRLPPAARRPRPSCWNDSTRASDGVRPDLAAELAERAQRSVHDGAAARHHRITQGVLR